MLALTDQQLGMLAIAATDGACGRAWPMVAAARRAARPATTRQSRWRERVPQRPRRSPPKGQDLLLVGRVAVRLNETAGPAGQPLSIPPRHVSDLRGDELRDVSDPTFLHIERQDLN